MKRTLTGIAAASMVLGLMAPAALASTSSTKYNHIQVSVGSGYSVSANGVAAKDPWTNKATEFMPLWYLQQGLKAAGYTVTWDGSNQTLSITTPDGSTSGLTAVTGSTKGDLVISINGVNVVKAPKALVAKDPASGKNTSFLPVFYIKEALNMVGITSTYDGTAGTWTNTVPAAAKLAVTGAPSSDIAVGTSESLGLTDNGTAVTSGVSWSTTSGAVVDSSGNFVASKAGTYTVTATYEGQSATTTITVYGAAADVKLSPASSSLVADDNATDTIKATVVDSNGNTVSDYNGTVYAYVIASATGDELQDSSGNPVASSLGTPVSATAVNGVATFTLQSMGTTKGTDIVYVKADNTTTWETTSISAVSASAASIGFEDGTGTADPTSLNSATDNEQAATSQLLNLSVLDQSGQPVASGAYTASVTLSGPAVLGGTGTGTIASGSGTQSGTVTIASGTGSIPIEAVSSTSAGPIQVTVSVTGLGTATYTVNAYNPGAYAQLGLASTPKTTSFSADTVGAATTTPFQTYSVQAEDASGHADATGTLPAGVNVTVLGPDGKASPNIGVWNGTTAYDASTSSTPVEVTGTGSYSVELGLVSGATSIPAGTYTVKIADATAGSKVSPLTETFTVTAGTANTVVVTPASTVAVQEVSLSNPTTTVTAQLQDAWGNNISQPGVVIDFAGAGTVAPSVSSSEAQTNASGEAQVTASWASDSNLAAGDEGYVTAAIDTGNDITGASTTAVDSATFEMESVVATTLTATPTASSYIAGNDPTFTALATDAAGANVADTLDYTVTGPSAYGTQTGFTTTAGQSTSIGTDIAGTYTVKVTDAANTNLAPVTFTFTVKPDGYDYDAALFDSSGTNTDDSTATIAADTSTTLTVSLTDSYGNPVTYSTAQTVTLSDGDNGGVFYQNGQPVTSVTIPAGSTGVTVTYENSTAVPESDLTYKNVTDASPYVYESYFEEEYVYLEYTGDLTAGQLDPSQFTVTDNGANVPVVWAYAYGDGYVYLELGTYPNTNDELKVSYTPGSTAPVLGANGTPVAGFSNLLATYD